MEVKFWCSKWRGRLLQVIWITKSLASVTREVVNIFIDINYLVTSFAFLLEWLRPGGKDYVFQSISSVQIWYIYLDLVSGKLLTRHCRNQSEHDRYESRARMCHDRASEGCPGCLRSTWWGTDSTSNSNDHERGDKNNPVSSALVHSTFLVCLRNSRLRYERA